MLSYLTPADIANTVRLTRTLHTGTIVITEGDTDARVYKRLLSKTHCRIVPSNGKSIAIQVALILNGTFSGILTIVDSDFDRLDSIPPLTVNILYTDAHDLETMLLCSLSLGKVLDELVSHSKAKKLRKPIIDLAIQACLPLGYLRWLSCPTKDNLNLRFSGILLTRFVRLPSFNTNIDLMIGEAIANTTGCTLDLAMVKTNLQTLMGQHCDVWQVCSGHDLVEMIFVGLKSHFGNRKTRRLTLELFDSMLRVAYEKSYFRTTTLHQAIVTWQNSNPGFQVLD